MITYLETSIFDSPAQAVVNTVNIVGVMGKGIALSFKKLYPAMYADYRKACEDGRLKIGGLHIYRTPNKIIVNFPTKIHWRQRSDPAYIEAGLKTFVAHFADYGITSVSFPQLGCGNGELDWETQVRPLMERYLKPLPIPVYIHQYRPLKVFIPERLDKAYSRELQHERARISATQFWDDLAKVLSQSKQANLFGDALTEWFDNDFLHLVPSANTMAILYRGDVEDFWHMLRLNGLVNCRDVPPSIVEAGADGRLFDLMEKLPYIKALEARPLGAASPCRALQYNPPAVTTTHSAVLSIE